MTAVDLDAGRFDINMEQSDDLTVVCTFNISLTGYTAWDAKAFYNGVNSAFTVDTTQQASKIITLTLGTAVTALFTHADWRLKATDPNGKKVTFFKGVITADVNP